MTDIFINKCPKILIVNTSYRNRKPSQETIWNWAVLNVAAKRKQGQEQPLRERSVLLSPSTQGPETQVQWSFSGQRTNSIERSYTMSSTTHLLNNNTHLQKQLDSRNLVLAIAKNNFMILSNKISLFCRVQTSLGRRTCSFGYGNKFDFSKLIDKYIPPPTAYTIKSRPKPVTKFAYGRDETKATGLYGNSSKNPAPNTYNLKDTLSSIKFSFGERTKAKRIVILI